MSLINKMLQDLDARGGQEAHGVPGQVKPVPLPERGMPVRAIGIGVALVAMIGAGSYAVWRYTHRVLPPAAGPLAPVATTAPRAPILAGTGDPTAVGTPGGGGASQPATPGPLAAAAGGPAAASARAASGRSVATSNPPVTSGGAAGGGVSVTGSASGAGSADSTAVRGAAGASAPVSSASSSSPARTTAAGGDKAADARLTAAKHKHAKAGKRPARDSASVSVLASKSARAKLGTKNAVADAKLDSKSGRRKAARPATAAQAFASTGKQMTAQQQAESLYHRATAALQDGHVSEAMAQLLEALKANPRHDAARQTLVGLLVEARRPEEAMQQLQTGLTLDPRQPAMAMLLARLQMERGGDGIDTLRRSLPYAIGDGEYHAFLAGALQRAQRHREAIEQFQSALKVTPSNGVWWMGLGLSLQAEKRLPEAADAFRRAKSSGTLSPELQTLVDRKLQQFPR